MCDCCYRSSADLSECQDIPLYAKDVVVWTELAVDIDQTLPRDLTPSLQRLQITMHGLDNTVETLAIPSVGQVQSS